MVRFVDIFGIGGVYMLLCFWNCDLVLYMWIFDVNVMVLFECLKRLLKCLWKYFNLLICENVLKGIFFLVVIIGFMGVLEC